MDVLLAMAELVELVELESRDVLAAEEGDEELGPPPVRIKIPGLDNSPLFGLYVAFVALKRRTYLASAEIDEAGIAMVQEKWPAEVKLMLSVGFWSALGIPNTITATPTCDALSEWIRTCIVRCRP